MTDRGHKLSLARQAALLEIGRGGLYYEPRPPNAYGLRLKRRIDDLHMEYRFAGSRMMKGLLWQDGSSTGRLHVATCMKQMSIEALQRRPHTSKPAPAPKSYPYPLLKQAVTRPNQVWAMVLMDRGFVYLTAVVGWFGRKVLAWRLSVTLETGPCLEALDEAMARYGTPENMNTDRRASSSAQRARKSNFAFLLATSEARIALVSASLFLRYGARDTYAG